MEGMMAAGNTFFLVEERSNPSTDFFVLPALLTLAEHVQRCSFTDLPLPSALDGAVVVFVRYLPKAWMQLIARERHRLHTLIFFMDDDVLDMGASAGMPWRYRLKLGRLAAWRKEWLLRQQAQLWVSTPYLEKKYAHWSPKLLLPMPIAGAEEVRRVFYHGSASHGAEISWLRPVVDIIMQKDSRIHFEIVGGREVSRLYRGVPRVTVVHPMQWSAYQGFLAMPGRHIGLAPQLDGAFNRARSYTKFFDITRCGAVGVYAREGSCGGVVVDGESGLLVERDVDAWVEVVLSLVGNEGKRLQMLDAAGQRIEALAAEASAAASDLLR